MSIITESRKIQMSDFPVVLCQPKPSDYDVSTFRSGLTIILPKLVTSSDITIRNCDSLLPIYVEASSGDGIDYPEKLTFLTVDPKTTVKFLYLPRLSVWVPL